MILFFKTLLYFVQGLTLFTVINKRKICFNSSLRYFIYYLVFVSLIIEVSANLVRKFTSLGNHFIYNIYDIVTYTFFLFWFYSILKQKKMVKFLMLIYFIGLIFSLIFEDFFNILNINYYIGTIIILILVVTYFSSLLQKKEVIHFTKIPEFWISTGILVFNIGYLPIAFLLNFQLAQNDRVTIQIVILLLNVILYGCFIKAFLCQKKI